MQGHETSLAVTVAPGSGICLRASGHLERLGRPLGAARPYRRARMTRGSEGWEPGQSTLLSLQTGPALPSLPCSEMSVVHLALNPE